MLGSLAIHVGTLFGLAFDVQKAPKSKSGFTPAQGSFETGTELFGDFRLKGFVAALECGFAERLVVVGGTEGRYSNEKINRAVAIRQILINDCGIPSRRIQAIESAPNTAGNMIAIKASLREMDIKENDCAITSNHYHLSRANMEMFAADICLQLFPAESLWLTASDNEEERISRINQLTARFGGNAFAERVTHEIKGIADRISGLYSRLPLDCS